MQIKKQLVALIVACAFIFGVTMPGLALEGETEAEGPDLTEQTTTTELRKAQKQQRIDAIKQKNAARKVQIKQEVCTKKTQILNDKIDHLAKQVNKHKEVFDRIYDRVLEFHDGSTANIANFDTLKANTDAKKLAAEASIDALRNFEFDVDCTDPSVGTQLANYKESVKEAKDALKEYRKAIVELVKSIHEAVKANGSEDSGEENE